MNSFTIKYDDYAGDFDLAGTVNSGQTSQIPFVNNRNTYSEIFKIDDTNVLTHITQEDVNKPVNIRYTCEYDVNEKKLEDKLRYTFDLDYDIVKLYDFMAEDDKLSDIQKYNTGLRLYKAQNPFECIISSICSANNSIKRWTETIRKIRKNHGESMTENSTEYYLFPDENTFSRIPEETLKKYGTGYRSSYMINSTEKILENSNFHKNILNKNYNDAYNILTDLKGVGPKVADCILLYGYDKHEAYPVDIWINRITTYLYFNNKKTSNNRIRQFAEDQFGKYAGYIQLYLFNYARKSRLIDKIKKK